MKNSRAKIWTQGRLVRTENTIHCAMRQPTWSMFCLEKMRIEAIFIFLEQPLHSLLKGSINIKKLLHCLLGKAKARARARCGRCGSSEWINGFLDKWITCNAGSAKWIQPRWRQNKSFILSVISCHPKTNKFLDIYPCLPPHTPMLTYHSKLLAAAATSCWLSYCECRESNQGQVG